MDQQQERLAYSIQDAATVTGLSRAYLYKLMQRGKLGFIKLGRRRLIPRSALLRMIEGKAA